MPTLVIHGRADTLILPSGGERTAELVPGGEPARFHDMGHDLPEPLWPLITDAIASHAATAESAEVLRTALCAVNDSERRGRSLRSVAANDPDH